jgi:uncharacterized membrane protein YgcG
MRLESPTGVSEMSESNTKTILSLLLAASLAVYPLPSLYASGQQSTPATSSEPSPTEPAPQTAAELQALVAPIALYPDSLVAQILTAATFPDQVAVASYWLQQNKTLTGSALMQAADKQTWDPSVKALTQFPSVLENLATNLTWTSSLGEAYHFQQAEVMTAIQTLRSQAQAKGALKSSSQITVVQQSPQVIVIQPANPQVVYVPQYNPMIVYGTPYVVPYYTAPTYSTGDVVAAGLLGFGAGIAVGAMMSGGCCGWGYSSWSCGWHGTAVVYHGGAYYGNAGWHGGYYNGGNHYGNNYNSYHSNYNSSNRNNGNSYNRNVSGNTVNVNKPSSQSFNSGHDSSSNSWAQHSDSHSSAFGGSNGWSSRSDSSRGWGSMRSSGFGGGRLGGGGGGFGGGGFRR